ncbi:1,3-beta-glucanosyltransferase [Parastagonospora nodorum]|nr:1,3-beta-glucanosyltransferase [Parastagonospora nodorum]KAH4187129.1 1,3-beta-glucanosyltransferase [Parastagonospora nodorum]KAH5111724.1 1,3-beta-glucanosyltransferase [Parastagonospora nodorum]KAH5507192.1 1,3-beta-glucanosyltransferase [Parastagonospora nodorum]
MVHFLATLALAVTAGLSCVSAIPTISAKGSKFFTSDGNQFYVKGVAYQLVPEDPLITSSQCSLDANLMKTIGANSIRVYHVDPKGNHDACMKAFADAGIYVWLDLDTFNTQIYEAAPQWNSSQRDAFALVMDAFHSYDNLGGFFVGNEAITTANGSVTAPYVKAAARDLKAYRDSKSYRKIPIGYSAADIASLRPMLQNYLACGTNSSETLDFFSLNSYSWCGGSSYMQSGYDQLEKMSESLHIPIFMSETGCNTVRPRDFKDQEAIFGDMADTWSGSIIYEWIEEANNYGIVKYGDKVDPASPRAPPDGFPRSGTPIPVQPDFSNLANVWKTLSPSGVKESAYNPSQAPVSCPAFTAGAWEVNPTAALPTMGQVHNFASGAASSTERAAGATGGPTGTSTPAPAGSQGAAADNLGRDLKRSATAAAGVLALLAWL